jgi:hypothetical protein
MIWDLLSDNQKEEVKEYVKDSGFEIGQVFCQVKENTKEPMVFDSEMNKVDINDVIQGVYLRDLETYGGVQH